MCLQANKLHQVAPDKALCMVSLIPGEANKSVPRVLRPTQRLGLTYIMVQCVEQMWQSSLLHEPCFVSRVGGTPTFPAG